MRQATATMPDWALTIDDVLVARPHTVQPSGTSVPQTINLRFKPSDLFTRVAGFTVRDGISLVRSLPSYVPENSTLSFQADGMELGLADNELLQLLVPDGLVFKGSLEARLDETGLRLEGGDNGKGFALPLKRASVGLRALVVRVLSRRQASDHCLLPRLAARCHGRRSRRGGPRRSARAGGAVPTPSPQQTTDRESRCRPSPSTTHS
ncbi:hypothetical protein ACFTWS_33430 [Streptomyces sp. NPDC057027]|uniref:hypothetical protein n=1 Tax=Streptomyces sp. NPDC057027 TaxID=3346004 RepID=UPI003645B994